MESFLLSIMANITCSIFGKSGKFIKDKFISMMKVQLETDDTATLRLIATEVEKLEIDDEMNEKAISRRIEKSRNIQQLVESLDYNRKSVIQNHSGNGDNIAGNKNIYNNKE